MEPDRNILPLGRMLVAEGLISEDVLHSALEEQKKCGCRLGQILIGKGTVNNFVLYQALAKHFNLSFANLIENPSDKILLVPEDRKSYCDLGIIPWKWDGDKIILAVTDINPEVTAWAKEHYGQAYYFSITSPFDILWTIQQNFSEIDDNDARERLQNFDPSASAKTLLDRHKDRVLAGAIIALPCVVSLTDLGLWIIFIVMNLFYAVTQLFKLALFITGARADKEEHKKAYNAVEVELPIYTILIPLFQEESVLHQLVAAIRNLDYPKSKLDVKLIVEAADHITIDAIKALQCESYFEIVPVPYSLPQTKPKACNYALRFARGEYITIYDAEDIPHPGQLKAVLEVFRYAPQNVACVQARLNYYNREENLLTRMFALEYGIWFDYMLPGLEKLDMPIPLGGTSNHIKRAVLDKLHAWDPYNVTEDADLGIRMEAQGYKTLIVDSLTLEEAPLSLNVWIKQRSRWVKGYMQTYFVHMRHPFRLIEMLGVRGFTGFQLFIGAPCFIFLISPFMWGLLGILWFSGSALSELFPQWLYHLAWFNLGFGYLLQLGFALMLLARNQWWGMLIHSLLFPLYWLLHSFASFKALKQLVVNPSYWEKTQHGVSRYVK